MKKIYKLVVTAIAFFAIMPSCSQLLEPEPYGLVDLDLVWTKYNYTATLVGSIGGASEWNSSFVYSPYCDEAQHVNDRTGGGYYNWYTKDFLSGNFPLSSGYSGYYNNIRTINFFLAPAPGKEKTTYANITEEAKNFLNRDDLESDTGKNSGKFSFTNIDDEELEFWLAKAHFYRAWYYFMLMKRFGQAVIITDIYDQNETFQSVKLNSVEEIADFIISELDFALSAPEHESSALAFRWRLGSGQWNRINRGFAWVLKARTAMYAASPLYYKEGSKYTWEYAYQMNKEAVEQLLAHDHKLFDIEPNDNYAYCCYDYYHIYPSGDDVITRSTDKETILANKGSLNMWQTNGLPTTKARLSCGSCPTQELVDAFETIDGEPILDLEKPYLDEFHLQPNYNPNNTLYDPENPYENRDPRFYGTIYYNGALRYWDKPKGEKVWTYVGGNCGISTDPNSDYYTRTGYYLRKFNCDKSSDEYGNYDGRVHMARLAEMYLNLAECACEAGHLEDAYDNTNLVRERVGMPDLPDNLTQDQLRLRIRNERRVELAFENFRFDDVRRWKIIDQTEEHVTGMQITKDSATDKFIYTRIDFPTRTNKGDSKYLLYPMSEDEVNKMKYLTGDDWQTPGWE